VASRGVLQSPRQFIPPHYTMIYISMETSLALCLAHALVQVQPCGDIWCCRTGWLSCYNINAHWLVGRASSYRKDKSMTCEDTACPRNNEQASYLSSSIITLPFISKKESCFHKLASEGFEKNKSYHALQLVLGRAISY